MAELFGSEFVLNSGQVIGNVHPAGTCAGTYCVIHNPSPHHMRDWPLNFRNDLALMERICPHGVGHPDPDSLAFQKTLGNDYKSVHGCCGCCHTHEEK